MPACSLGPTQIPLSSYSELFHCHTNRVGTASLPATLQPFLIVSVPEWLVTAAGGKLAGGRHQLLAFSQLSILQPSSFRTRLFYSELSQTHTCWLNVAIDPDCRREALVIKVGLLAGTKGIFGLIRQQFDYQSFFCLEVSSSIWLRPKDYILVVSEGMCLPTLESEPAYPSIRSPVELGPSSLHLLSVNVVCNAKDI